MRTNPERRRLVWLLVPLLGGCPEAPAPVPPLPPLPPLKVTAPPPLLPLDAGALVPAPPVQLPALVLSLSGSVEVQRGDGGDWMKLTIGEPVRVGDKLRLAADGQVELSFDVAQIKVHEGTELELTLLDPKEVSVSANGTVEVENGAGAASVTGGGLVARTRGGRISFTYDGHTAVAGALNGTASLTTGEKTVTLREGEFAATGEAGLGTAAKMPRTLTLEVAWPATFETNQPALTLKGKVSTRARVSAGGKWVEPAPDGTFELRTELRQGRQTVIVTAKDAFGRRLSRAHQFVLDREAVKIKGAVEYH